MAQATRPLTSREERVVIAVDRAIYHLARRWLWLFDGVSAILVALPVLAPYLAAHSHGGIATWIYRAFHLVCDQRPDRSFYLFGQKLAYCERCTAIYGGLLLLGLIFALLRRHLRPASLRTAICLSIPMAVDGFTQLFGWRESNWELRVVTGALFAVALAWLVLPRLEEGFQEIAETQRRRFGRLALQGRARPL